MIGKKDVVQARPVQLGPVIGGLRVIRSGVSAQDRIIVNGIQRAMPGKPAKVEVGTIAPDGKVLTPKSAAPAAKAKGDAK